jgi:thiamine biosynthesis lipoprotein
MDVIEIRRMRPLLGTYVEVGLRASASAAAEGAMASAFEAIDDIHQRLSFHAADSELSRLNGAPGTAVPLHRRSLRLLRLGQGVMRASGGLFDLTLGGALVRRGLLPDHGGPPPLARGRADDLELGRGWARLRRPVRLTLDGIAKGYAVDLAVAALRRAGAHAGWVNAGGDLRVFGDLVLPVQRREADRRLVALGGLRNAALATSRVGGAHRNAFPGLILDGTRTPVRRPAYVVSVLARRAWRADALTKVAALAAPTEAQARVQRLGGCIVTPAGARQ